jgi:hypothetical protein
LFGNNGSASRDPVYLDPGGLQHWRCASPHARVGITGNEKDAPNTGSNDGFSARWCTSVERTWFKGGIEIGPLCTVTGSRQRDSFCMWAAGRLGSAYPNHLPITHDHCPNRRIRAGTTDNSRCLLQSKGNKVIRCEALVMIIHRDTPFYNLRGIAGRTMKQRRATGRC